MRRSTGSLSSDWSGIGSAPGPPAESQAAVQSDRSCLDGLPVRLVERTVSRDEAASIRSLVYGAVSASWVVSQTDPVHTPSAPSAMAAAICLPVTIPPA